MLAVVSERGLRLLEYLDPETFDARMARLHPGPVSARGDHETLDAIESELGAYFAGKLLGFTVPLDLDGSEFQLAVWQGLLAIPYGQTRSYGQQAASLPQPGVARAVGRANGDNPVAIVVPCHRVIRADGHLCGYGGGLWRKQWLLEHERRVLGVGQMSLPMDADVTSAS
jgi:AraC family transcriptional regulator of adaptative response/methylated-DNA-[protein]-cysteine methyltransferase